MSAFGSYKDEVTVDFTVADHGIFLITGDTGAGKTTIFDAITYALYDRSSTDVKNGSMMRSQYAAGSTPTFVELVFEERGEQYRIRRNPAYVREGKRKGKDGAVRMTEEKPAVSLYLPDGSLFPGKVKETNERIAEIVGLGADQFTQTVMLAQGEFMRLLLASSKERKEIFARLFDTSLYGLLQQKLRARAKELEEQLTQGQRQWELYERELDWQQEPAKSLSTKEKLLERLREEIEAGEQEQEKGRLQEQELEQEINRLRAVLVQIGQEHQLFERLEQAKKQEALLMEQEAEASQQVQRLELGRRARQGELAWKQAQEAKKRTGKNREEQDRLAAELEETKSREAVIRQEAQKALGEWKEKQPSLQEQIIAGKAMLPGYDRLEQANVQKEQVQKEGERLKRQQQLLEKEQQACRARTASLSARLDEIREAPARLAQQEAQQKELEQRLQCLRNIAAELEQLSAEWDEYQNSAAQAVEASRKWRAGVDHYDRLYRSFLEEQAGLMAQNLQEGEKCPVCGAVHHPQLRRLSEHAPTQQQVEEAKKTAESAERAFQDASGRQIQKKQQFVSHQKHIGQLAAQELGEDFQPNRAGLVHVKAAAAELEKDKKALEAQLDGTRKEADEQSRGEGRLRQLNQQLTEFDGRKDVLQKKRLEAETALAAQVQLVKQLQERLIYPDKRQAQQVLQQQEQSLSRLEARKDQTQRALEEIQGRLQNQKGQKQRLQEEAQVLRQEQEEAQSRKEACFSDLGFADDAAYEAACMDLQQYERLEAWIRGYEQKKTEAAAAVETLSRQTSGLTRREEAPWQEKLGQKQSEREMLAQQQKQRLICLEQQKRILNSLSGLYLSRKKLEEQYAVASRMDKTAGGRVAGMAGLDFQTYLQRRYFKQIIRQANSRLADMTGGEYLLYCRDIQDLGRQGEVGLDLDVYSTITGKQRDVKTLSGGESFMAALSMALGMADIIRNLSGRIQIDMMFIDEGFGTLDEDSRNQAIRILSRLAGDRRLIGIISHVTQLKEQIQRKLIVTKDRQGSSIRWELG